jgi:hypothetical protein
MIPSGCRVHLPDASPTSSAFPKSRRWVGFPELARKKIHAAGVSRSRLVLTFRPPGLLAWPHGSFGSQATRFIRAQFLKPHP